jgi:hypothetical protein
MNSKQIVLIILLKTASFEDNDRDNGPLATLTTDKNTFSQVCHHVFFYQFAWGLMELFFTATFEPFWSLHGHFTATHGHKFSTANNFLSCHI